MTSAIGLSLTRDSRDFVAAPTKGAQTALSFDFAGLGGDSKFIKVNALQTYFLPIWWGHVLGFRAEANFDEIIRAHVEDELGGRIAAEVS